MRLFKKIIWCFLILIVLDQISGRLLEHFFYQQFHGDDYITIQCLDSTSADIIIMGSSRASHHYHATRMQQRLKQEVFNAGRDNMGIHYTYATLQSLLTRHHPQYLILDIIPYNYLAGQQEHVSYKEIQTAALLPFASRHATIANFIHQWNPIEYYKMKSIKSYPYNSLIGAIVQNAYTHLGHHQVKGFEPVFGQIDLTTYTQPIYPFPHDTLLNKNAMDMLAACLQLAKQNQISCYVVVSPFYFRMPAYPNFSAALQQLCEQYQCRYIDYSRSQQFLMQSNLFYDELHLNETGAAMFSDLLVQQLHPSNP